MKNKTAKTAVKGHATVAGPIVTSRARKKQQKYL